MKIEGSTILVTGANRGIGLSLVRKALELGARKVYATYRSDSGKSSFAEFDDRVVPVQLDLLDAASIASLADATSDINILINNAGIFTAADVLEDTNEQLRNDFETNFFGTIDVTRALVPALKQNQPAAIANLSSIVGLAPMPSLGGYSASKAAAHSMTQSIRGKLREHGVTVHGVYPGPIDTEMAAGLDMEKSSPDVTAVNILSGIQSGVEEIFPDPMSEQMGAVYARSAKELEANFSAG